MKRPATNSAVVPSAESVRSSTNTASATNPNVSPRSLTVYENARRRNPGALMAALAGFTARKPTRPASRTGRDLPIFAGVSGVRRLMSLAEVALLGCSVVGIALAWDAADWDPLGL